MLTEEEILNTLDNYRNGYDPAFVELGHPYTYPIDSRVNVFRNNQGKWALAIETLGYSPRGGPVALEITYYGNCLVNLEKQETYFSNSYFVLVVDEESFNNTIEYETLKPGAKFWTVRGRQIELSHINEEYLKAGVELKEYEPNEISAEEVGRLFVTKYQELFRATDEELYKSIPKDLDKIMVIDEWHHRDFYQNNFSSIESLPFPVSVLEQLGEGFDFNEYNQKLESGNKAEWENNRPGSYETWQLIAKVLVTGDTTLYKPKLKPTSHWKNWPEAGTM